MKNKNQKGVALLIVIIVVIVMIAIVLSISVISVNKIKLISEIGKSVIAFYDGWVDVEKLKYHDRIMIPPGGERGACSIGDYCPTDANDPTGDPATHCNNVVYTGDDCNSLSCMNCKVTYYAVWDNGNRRNDVSATVICPYFDIDSVGSFKDVIRQIFFRDEENPHVIKTCALPL